MHVPSARAVQVDTVKKRVRRMRQTNCQGCVLSRKAKKIELAEFQSLNTHTRAPTHLRLLG